MSHEPSTELDELAQKVIGAAIEVHFHHKAEREVPVEVTYKGRVVGRGRIELLVEGKLVVELKTVEAIGATHIAHVITYLKATGRELGVDPQLPVPAVLGAAIKQVIYHEPD